MANDALKLLDHLEIPATHVLSFSLLGGAIALQLALEDPTRTERLAMIAPGGTPDNASVSILNQNTIYQNGLTINLDNFV